MGYKMIFLRIVGHFSKFLLIEIFRPWEKYGAHTYSIKKAMKLKKKDDNIWKF